MNSSGAAPVPPSVPSTTMKSGVMLVSSIALTSARTSQGWPTQSLKPAGLPPASRRTTPIEMLHFNRRRERRMRGRRDAVLTPGHPTNLRDLPRHLGRRQDAAVPRFGSLAQFELDHLDLRRCGHLGEAV